MKIIQATYYILHCFQKQKKKTHYSLEFEIHRIYVIYV